MALHGWEELFVLITLDVQLQLLKACRMFRLYPTYYVIFPTHLRLALLEEFRVLLASAGFFSSEVVPPPSVFLRFLGVFLQKGYLFLTWPVSMPPNSHSILLSRSFHLANKEEHACLRVDMWNFFGFVPKLE